MRKVAEDYNVHMVNLEGLVPGELWGTKDSTSLDASPELDFMHFQAAGHKLLASKLYEEMLVVIGESNTQ